MFDQTISADDRLDAADAAPQYLDDITDVALLWSLYWSAKTRLDEGLDRREKSSHLMGVAHEVNHIVDRLAEVADLEYPAWVYRVEVPR